MNFSISVMSKCEHLHIHDWLELINVLEELA
jgi:hypothetical protein